MKILKQIAFPLLAITIACITYNVREFTQDPYEQRKLFCFLSAVLYVGLVLLLMIKTKGYAKIGWGYALCLTISNLWDEARGKNLQLNHSELIAAGLGLIYTAYLTIKYVIRGQKVE